MIRPQPIGARRAAPVSSRDTSRAHMLTVKQLAAASSEVYGGRLVSFGLPDGPARVTLTGLQAYTDAVVIEFRYRDGRESSRRLDPATNVLIHRTTR